MTTREPLTGTPFQRARDIALAIVTYPLWIILALLLLVTSIIWVPLAIWGYSAHQKRIHAQIYGDRQA